METGVVKRSFIILFCLSSVMFFRPVFIPSSLLFYCYYAFFFLAILFIIFKFRWSEFEQFSFPVLFLLFAIFMSAASATLFWSQSIIHSIMALPLYLGYLLFFLLLFWKIQSADIEKIIIVLGFLYIVVFGITFIMFPTPVFGNIEGFSTDRGFQRVMLEGRGFLFLFSFYSLGRFYNRREPLWLIIFLITVVSVFMLLTRTLIAGSLVLWTLFILRKSRYINKVLAIFFIVGFVYLISQLNFSKLLMNQTVSQTENLNDYVRVKAATFYLNEFSPNIFAKVFGNGEPYIGTSYSDYMVFIEKVMGLYASDIGYIGLYSKFGLLSVFAFILLFIRTIKTEVTEEYLYGKYFLYFIFLISLIIDAPFSTSFITPIILALYLISSNDVSKSVETAEADK